MGSADKQSGIFGWIGLVWGLGGFFLLLLFAIYRLAPIAWEAIQQPLNAVQYALLVGNSLFMAYSEGYKGFQRAYSPRVVARAWHILENPTFKLVLLAPFFCMAYFGSSRKRMMTSWILTIAIIILILIFHRLPDPWRGILDAGVVIGLSWGIAATMVVLFRQLAGKDQNLDPELT